MAAADTRTNSFGEFLGKLHYRKQVHEMTEGFEGHEGYEEGEEKVKGYENIISQMAG